MPNIESPTTYGEHYWATQVEAAKAFEEEKEKAIAEFIPKIFGDSRIRSAMPFDILGKMEGLFSFPNPGLSDVGGRFISEIADSAVSSIMAPALRETTRAANLVFPNVYIAATEAAELFRRHILTPEVMNDRFAAEGYSTAERMFVQAAQAPFPSVPELIRYARYNHGERTYRGKVNEIYDMSYLNWDLWDWLSMQQLTTDQLLTLNKRQTTDTSELDTMIDRLGWSSDLLPILKDLSFTVPNAMLLLQADLFREQSVEIIDKDLRAADIHPEYREKYIDAVLTKPASQDLIAYHLRQENDLADLGRDLTRIGIHPEFQEVYQTLAHRLPPVADIISMAVREAFSPAIAQRFGQYEDFPEDFGKYAEQQGLSAEWAERYWAAHWGLPSPQQGFEMLHRGVITEVDLGLLMKAQDIMPFWRDKMIEIAYRPLTRVDVRRMYKEGVLSEVDVFDAYKDGGYSDKNAEAMTEFTIAYVLAQQSKFTSNDIIKAYTDRMIDISEARSLLGDVGVQSGDISYILDTADYKREWAITNNKTSAIRNLYKKGEYSDTIARSELLRLNLPSDHVETLMETWWFEKKAAGVKTWTKAETMGFMESGLITADRGRQELISMGYDDEHADTYIKAMTWAPPEN